MPWPFEYEELRIEFSRAVSRLGPRGLGFSLYGLRHEGASHDRSVKTRKLAAVPQRGCWRSFPSVRRYEKHGRLGLELNKLSPSCRCQAMRAPALVKS